MKDYLDGNKKLDMTKYGSTEQDGTPDKPGMVKFLLQQAKGGGSNYDTYEKSAEDENNTPTNGGNGKLEGAKA